MNRIWVGVAAGLLAATALVGVGIGAYRAGQDDDHVTRIVTEQGETVRDGGVVRVVDRDGWGWRGPGPGFFLFPLLLVGGIFLIARAGRGHRGYWGHGYGYYGGPGGPGRWGPPEDRVREWHRHLHEEDDRLASTAPGSSGTPSSESETTTPDVP